MVKLDVYVIKGMKHYKKVISMRKKSVPYFLEILKHYRLNIVSISLVKEVRAN